MQSCIERRNIVYKHPDKGLKGNYDEFSLSKKQMSLPYF